MFEKIILVLLFSSTINCLDVPGVVSGLVSGVIDTIAHHKPGVSDEKCEAKIYRDCNRQTVFTDEELENVRQYLNETFTQKADIKPDKPLCPKLHVRQDWKCLTKEQRDKVIYTWKKLYEPPKQVIQRLTDLHVKYWPSWHKTLEFGPGHRYMTMELDKHMREIDPDVTLPYWDPYTYGVHPELSSIWETLGHSGNYSTGYNVSDGIYAEWDLVPQIKRHWSYDGTIPSWFTPEFNTIWLQSSNSYPELTFNLAGIHFQPHLQIGGYEGQFAVRSAPYDILFYMFHDHISDIGYKKQLQKKEFLTPLSYDSNILPRLNPKTGKPDKNNIRTDILTGVPHITVRETFWLGFGHFCGVSDELITIINNIVKDIKESIPPAVERLPPLIKLKYFPDFAAGRTSGLYHTLSESSALKDCNLECLPLPKPLLYRETQQGRNQLEAYRFDEDLNLKAAVELSELRYHLILADLNAPLPERYCSPFVTPKGKNN